MDESKRYHKVGTSLYRYGTQGSYFAIWKEHGKLKKQKLKSRSQRNAKIEVSRLKEKYQKLKPEARAVTLLAAAEKYKGTLGPLARSTRQRAELIIEKLKLSELALMPVIEVKTSDLLAWLSEATTGFSRDYYNKYLGVLRKIFDLALADEVIFESPLGKVICLKVGDPERLTPTEEQAWAIIAHIRAQKYHRDAEDSGDFVEFLLLSGIGNGEAAQLRWRNVDWGENVLNVRRLKTDQTFKVPIFKSLGVFLKGLPQGGPEDPVLTVASARRAITKACERLGYLPGRGAMPCQVDSWGMSH